jgi:uncharacterized spore protein YtfJ
MNATSPTEEMVQSISEIPSRVGAGACFGQAIERDGHTMIPVARVSFGYGMGFGRGSGGDSGSDEFGHKGDSGEGEGGGGGGGGQSTPVAVIDITRDDVEIKPIMDPMRIALSWTVLVGWLAFWLFWTMRTISRESNKTRRAELSKSS